MHSIHQVDNYWVLVCTCLDSLHHTRISSEEERIYRKTQFDEELLAIYDVVVEDAVATELTPTLVDISGWKRLD